MQFRIFFRNCNHIFFNEGHNKQKTGRKQRKNIHCVFIFPINIFLMFFPPEIPIKGKLCDKVHTSPKQERSKSGFHIAIKGYYFFLIRKFISL